MGKWIKKPRTPLDTHKHETPRYATNGEDVLVGDRYECSCGDVFEINEILPTYGYDEPDGIRALYWRHVCSKL